MFLNTCLLLSVCIVRSFKLISLPENKLFSYEYAIFLSREWARNSKKKMESENKGILVLEYT